MHNPLPPVLIRRGEFLVCEGKGHRVAHVTAPIHSIDARGEDGFFNWLSVIAFIDASGKQLPVGQVPAWNHGECARCGGEMLRICFQKGIGAKWQLNVEGKGWVG